MNAQSSQKYRPYFSASELQEIIRCVKTSSTNLSLLRYLESFALKIQHGVLDVALELKPVQTLEQRLGLVSTSTSFQSNQPSGPNPEVDQPTLYQCWLANPSSLTPRELSHVHQYRYSNDLMTAQEELQYEDEMFMKIGPKDD